MHRHLYQLTRVVIVAFMMMMMRRNLLPLDVLICLYNALFLFFFYNMVLLSGIKHMHYTFDPIFKLQNKAVRATSLQLCVFPSLLTFINLKLLTMYEIFALRFLIFVLDSVNKFHLAAFITFS